MQSFTEPWDLGDVTFSVEDQLVFANRSILSMWSPVMKAMLQGDFIERTATVIPLPEKRFDDILELVRALHPPLYPVNGGNIHKLLPLAREYQIVDLTQRCEKYLSRLPPSLRNLVYAEEFSLEDLKEDCIHSFVTWGCLEDFVYEPEFQELTEETRSHILLEKATRYEKSLKDIKGIMSGDRPRKRMRPDGMTRCSFPCPSFKVIGVAVTSQLSPHDAGTESTCPECAVHMTKLIDSITHYFGMRRVDRFA